MTSERPLGLQKVCDIHDFFHPEIDRILREELRSVPFGSRRAWEFAMIFRALGKKGVLHEDAVGLGLGAGTEKLIYAIASHAGKTVVTDLYTDPGGWEGVRTEDPRKLVLSKAPWPVNPQQIEVLSMDMRDIKFPDDSFDFCWSTGAFEHIGHDEDFLRHFSEVHRVLRPGGVYAFTTAVVFGDKTLRIPHNYYFHPDHLLDLIHESPLHPEPEFDCRVTDHLYNRPHLERFQDYGFTAGHEMSKPIVSFRRGVLLAANVMVLTKDPDRPKARATVVGFDATCARLRRHTEKLLTRLWSERQVLRAELHRGNLFVQPQCFGSGTVELDFVLGTGAPATLPVTVTSRPIGAVSEWQIEREVQISRERQEPVLFDAVDERVYRIMVANVSVAEADRIVIRGRRLDAKARRQASSPPASPPPQRRTLIRRLRSGLGAFRRAFSGQT